MHVSAGRGRRRSASPAMVVAVIALITALGGSAWAAIRAHVLNRRHHQRPLPRHSVGTRQLKPRAVHTRNLAPGAVRGRRFARHTIRGSDIDKARLGTVPSAVHAEAVAVAASLSGRRAGCPGGTVSVRGICFDRSLSGPVAGVTEAAERCAARGGWLPTALELFSVRSAVDLGDGVPPHFAVADAFFADPPTQSEYSTMVVDGGGTSTIVPAGEAVDYVCAYGLFR